MIHYISHSNGTYDFSQTMYPAEYSFTITSYKQYFLCLTYEMIGMYFLVLYWVSCDTLFAQMLTHLTIHFKVFTIIVHSKSAFNLQFLNNC